MAPEVIDLISDSEDEATTAISAIQAFKPRQEKDISRSTRPLPAAAADRNTAQFHVPPGLRNGVAHAHPSHSYISPSSAGYQTPREPSLSTLLQEKAARTSSAQIKNRHGHPRTWQSEKLTLPKPANSPVESGRVQRSTQWYRQEESRGKRGSARPEPLQQRTLGSKLASPLSTLGQHEIGKPKQPQVQPWLAQSVEHVPTHETSQDSTRLTGDRSHAATLSPSISDPHLHRGTTPVSGKPQASNFNLPYTAEEDALLAKLKEVNNLKWENMLSHFNGRTAGSLQVRYSTKLKKRHLPSIPSKPKQQVDDTADPNSVVPARRAKKPRVMRDFVPWSKVRTVEEPQHITETDAARATPEETFTIQQPTVLRDQKALSLPRLLRHREAGTRIHAGWFSVHHRIPEALRNMALDDLGPRRSYNGTSGDVTSVAWSASGEHFAAGSIAISDERSMQYNRPRNLLLGHSERGTLYELPEHHTVRPFLDDSADNVNASATMRATQDPRLFTTVTSVGFSKADEHLVTTGHDGTARVYDSRDGTCLDTFNYNAAVDLLSISNDDILATACRSPSGSSILVHHDLVGNVRTSYGQVSDRSVAIHGSALAPSALKWGSAHQHKDFLLAGFHSNTLGHEHEFAGEVCLWNVQAETKIELGTAMTNVFDVAWNLLPSSASIMFATASSKRARGVRSVIQCFAAKQSRAKRVIEWNCPALDINDVLFCPHDDNLVAAGATNGNVYIWDKRLANRTSSPLHTLRHGSTLNVLDHDLDREIADTGVRFLSWSASGSRLYSGSSDGVVKVWDPYRSTENALVEEVATFDSAIMSGAFSSDYRDLLIGEDGGQLNHLQVGYKGRSPRAAPRFTLVPAPAPQQEEPLFATAQHYLSSGRLEIAPMGALPKRQVLQGPQYQGPFFKPTDDQMFDAERALRDALNLQIDTNATMYTALDGTHGRSQETLALREQVNECQAALENLQLKRETAERLATNARALQDGFDQDYWTAQARKRPAGSNLLVADCNLDCDYLPPDWDNDGCPPDSLRSEERIPGRLQSTQEASTSEWSQDELEEAGLTGKCLTCTGPAKRAKKGFTTCSTCTLKKSGFTAACVQCRKPARPATVDQTPTLCERCSFACFRCGQLAHFDSPHANVRCPSCRLTWQADILGYRLLTDHASDELGAYSSVEKKVVVESEDLEAEHFHSLWRIPLIDGA